MTPGRTAGAEEVIDARHRAGGRLGHLGLRPTVKTDRTGDHRYRGRQNAPPGATGREQAGECVEACAIHAVNPQPRDTEPQQAASFLSEISSTIAAG
jgi:hypothetical protein